MRTIIKITFLVLRKDGTEKKKSIAFSKADFYNLTDVVAEVSWDGCLKEEKEIRRAGNI